MIQLHLLILIIIFILFLILKKEPFTTDAGSSCQIGEVKGWSKGKYLIGCSSYDEGGIFIKLFWNKKLDENDKYYIILTETKDKTTQIIQFDGKDTKIKHTKDKNEQVINTYYKLDKTIIEEGHTYNITLNIEETDESKTNISASNTLEITALKQQIPDNNIQLSGDCNKQTKLFDNLKNKTFDFYL